MAPLTWFEPWLHRRARSAAGQKRLAELRARYVGPLEPLEAAEAAG